MLGESLYNLTRGVLVRKCRVRSFLAGYRMEKMGVLRVRDKDIDLSFVTHR